MNGITARDEMDDRMVTRLKLVDKASSYRHSVFDRLRARRLAWHPGVTVGRGVAVKAHVEIQLTDNATLRIDDHVLIDAYAYFQLTKPAPTMILGKYVGVGRHTVLAAKKLVTIGDCTQIGPYCQVNDHDHGTSRRISS